MKILGQVERKISILFVEEHSEEADGIYYIAYLDDAVIQTGSIDGSMRIDELMREIYKKEILKR